MNVGANFKFTYTYNITPTTNPVAARTAWNLSGEWTETEVSIAGFFAGQSTQLKSNTNSGWSFKASHTMTQSDGTPRLVDPVATITNDADTNDPPIPVCTLPLTTYLEHGADFEYLGNAGRAGNVGNLFDDGVTPNGTVNEIQDGVSIALNLKTDDFAGNNGTGGDRAVTDESLTPTCSIGTAGSYTVIITGILKGVGGLSSLPVAVDSSLCISAGTCSLCPAP